MGSRRNGSLLWHASRLDTFMEGNEAHTVFFMYNVQDHGLQFPLKAQVECTAPGVYTITDIRPESQDEGSLLPPISIQKLNGAWIFLDNGQESNLSATIGRAIEAMTSLA